MNRASLLSVIETPLVDRIRHVPPSRTPPDDASNRRETPHMIMTVTLVLQTCLVDSYDCVFQASCG